MTGVRSRWPRSATCSRSAATSSWIRSASALSARPSSAVSGGPPGTARAVESPSRSRCATSATSVTGTLVRRPSHRATATETATSPRPRATIVAQAPHTPARSSDVGTRRPRPRGHGRRDRHHGIQPVVLADGERRLVLCGRGSTAAAESAPSGSSDPSTWPSGSTTTTSGPRALRSATVRERVGGVVEGGDQGGHALRLLAGPGGGAVLGEVRDEEAQRHDEGHDDGGRRGGHQPRDAAGHQPSPSARGHRRPWAAARRTPTPRTLCRYTG